MCCVVLCCVLTLCMQLLTSSSCGGELDVSSAVSAALSSLPLDSLEAFVVARAGSPPVDAPAREGVCSEGGCCTSWEARQLLLGEIHALRLYQVGGGHWAGGGGGGAYVSGGGGRRGHQAYCLCSMGIVAQEGLERWGGAGVEGRSEKAQKVEAGGAAGERVKRCGAEGRCGLRALVRKDGHFSPYPYPYAFHPLYSLLWPPTCPIRRSGLYLSMWFRAVCQ